MYELSIHDHHHRKNIHIIKSAWQNNYWKVFNGILSIIYTMLSFQRSTFVWRTSQTKIGLRSTDQQTHQTDSSVSPTSAVRRMARRRLRSRPPPGSCKTVRRWALLMCTPSRRLLPRAAMFFCFPRASRRRTVWWDSRHCRSVPTSEARLSSRLLKTPTGFREQSACLQQQSTDWSHVLQNIFKMYCKQYFQRVVYEGTHWIDTLWTPWERFC